MKAVACNLTALSDVQLIKEIQQGNNMAFDVLMIRYSPHVRKCIRNIVHDTEIQKDIMQDVWLNVLTELRRNHYNDNNRFEGWLAKIAQHTALNTLRIEKHYIHSDQSETEEPFEIPPEGMDDTDKKILAAISGMQPVMKRVIILYALRQLKCKEIAEKMHVGINTITKILSRGYITIRKQAGLPGLKNNFRLSAVK